MLLLARHGRPHTGVRDLNALRGHMDSVRMPGQEQLEHTRCLRLPTTKL